jgi:hypothetical protein
MPDSSKDLELTPEAIAMGIIRARMLPHDNGNIVYLKIDPEKQNQEALKKESKDFWLYYKYNHTAQNEIPEKSIS